MGAFKINNPFWRRGEPFVWLSAGSLSFIVFMVLLFLFVIISNGIAVFWPKPLIQFELKNGDVLLGEIAKEEVVGGKNRVQVKVGNRDIYGEDFKWIHEDNVVTYGPPSESMAIERLEYGNFYGYPLTLTIPSLGISIDSNDPKFNESLAQGFRLSLEKRDAVDTIQQEILQINRKTTEEHNRLQKRSFAGVSGLEGKSSLRLKSLKRQFDDALSRLAQAKSDLKQDELVVREAGGKTKTILVSHMVRYTTPNTMGLGEKTAYYGVRLWELLWEDPRESNTEGGLFPAIFGTVLLIIIMSIMSFPFGVIAGIYLREYAKDGALVRMIRIAVNNLAGIPAIVYGIFGLGFFVYGVGSGIDSQFFPERLPEPTFGTGGILWASLTLGILTIPVVIVATEEALGAIPRALRESSYALGATKLQTLIRVLLPSASGGIMTGFILAMSRAAGEVAPLMITGVVKLAPNLPIDGQSPFFHLNRKFMHLGFHIYDISH